MRNVDSVGAEEKKITKLDKVCGVFFSSPHKANARTSVKLLAFEVMQAVIGCNCQAARSLQWLPRKEIRERVDGWIDGLIDV